MEDGDNRLRLVFCLIKKIVTLKIKHKESTLAFNI